MAFTDRLQNVRRNMQVSDLDAIALIPGFNMHYLTGIDFHLVERPFVLFIPAPEDRTPILLIPGLEAPGWERHAPFEARLHTWDDADGPEAAMKTAADELGDITRLGAEYLRMRLLEHDLIQRHLPDTTFAPAEAAMDPVRIIKDQEEIEQHRKAIAISEAALEEVVGSVKVGERERDIAGRLSAALLAGGGETLSFEPAVISGPKSAMPHGTAGERVLEKGDILLIDFGTRVGGYHSDITRCFHIGGEPEAKLVEVHETVVAANKAARDAVRPGDTFEAVDQAARAVIEAAGYGEYFIHRTGHGLGLDIHEAPSVVAGNDSQMNAGMVFTIEPGIYIEGWGGIRIEDDVVVTDNGGESLTSFPRSLQTLAI